MAVIVQEVKTKQKYILLGAGYGAYRATRPSLFFGNLVPKEEEGACELVAVCNHAGQIGWIPPEELVVISVDGQEPKVLLDV